MFVLLLELFPVVVGADDVNLEQHFVHFAPFIPLTWIMYMLVPLNVLITSPHCSFI